MIARLLLAACLASALTAADHVWRQWQVAVDGGMGIASGSARLCQLGHYQWQPGKGAERDGALVYEGVQGDRRLTAVYRWKEGRLSCAISARRGGAPVGFEMMLSFAAGDLAGGTVQMDGRPVAIPKAFAGHEFPHAATYAFFEDQPAKRMSLRMDRCRFANLRDFRGQPGRSDMQVFMVAGDDGELAFTIDLTRSMDASRGERFPGERFAWQDDLHLFDPGSRANRIANPSFEAGLDCWTWGITDMREPPGRDVWAVDDQVAHSGRRSVRYTIAKGFHPRMLCTPAIAVEPGRPLTVSYWARADRPSGVSAHLFVWGTHWGDFPVVRNDRMTDGWQRFTATMTPKSPFLRVALGDHWWASADGQVEGARVWYDDVQVEAGESATDFSQAPMLARSDTGTADQLVALDALERTPLAVRVVNASAAAATIAVTARLQDADRRTLLSRSFAATLPPWAEGGERIPLSDPALQGLRGLLRVEMELDNGSERSTAYGRLCLYEPVPDNGRLRYGLHLEQPTAERAAALKPLGVGGSLGFGPLADRASDARLRDAGWMHIVGPYADNFPLDFYKVRPDAAAWSAFKAWFAPIAAAHPDQLWWKTFNEPNCGGHVATPEDLVPGVALIRDAVKSVNPQAMILSPDPYNASRHGQSWIDQFLAAGGAKSIDALAIHTYRARPEDPDLDSDIQSLIAMKARYGLAAAPILFTEGEGYQRYTVPEIGMSPFGFWEWRMGSLSRDLGRSELTAGALMARTLLACLKNADHVKFYLSWTDTDASDVPFATLATTNWLLARLRHATFQREFAIGDGLRSYLFIDPARRPIAAVWSYSLPVDRGEKPGFDLTIALPAGTVAHDCMGNPIAASRSLLITGRPTYLIGEPGSAEALTAALDSAKADGLGTTVVDVTLRLRGADGLTIAAANRLPRPISGQLGTEIDGRPAASAPLSLAAKSSATVAAAVPPAPANALASCTVAIAFAEAGGSVNRREERLRRLGIPHLPRAIAIDGDAGDWDGVPSLGLDGGHLMSFDSKEGWRGAGDLSARVRFGWRDDGLYLLAEVADDVHKQTGKAAESAWQHDAMQFYIDLLADGRDRPGRGYDANDETFCISDAGDGKGRIWREYTPEWQVAFVKQGLVDAPCAVRRSGQVTTYEMRLPPKEVFPLEMKPGTAFGCALIIGDADAGERTKALVTTPAGTEPHGKPELWPAAVLLP